MGIVIQIDEPQRVSELLAGRGWHRGGDYLIKDLGDYYWLAEIRGSVIIFNCGMDNYTLELLHKCVDELGNEVHELSRELGEPIEVGKIELQV
jgi:hypothetical protein